MVIRLSFSRFCVSLLVSFVRHGETFAKRVKFVHFKQLCFFFYLETTRNMSQRLDAPVSEIFYEVHFLFILTPPFKENVSDSLKYSFFFKHCVIKHLNN